jgi:hypothetical protein
MAGRNSTPGGKPAGKWSPKQGETLVCALHKLPLDEKKGKKYVRSAGEVKLVDCTYFVCPAGCCDAHVEIDGDKTTPIPGLTAWKRTAKEEAAKAALAEFKKDKAGYVAKVVPVQQPRKHVQFRPVEVEAAKPEKPAKTKE